MTAFVHPNGLCETTRVGDGTRIWAFAHVLPGAVIGRDCNICDHVFIENDVVVGDRVTVKCGVQLWDGVTLEDDVFVGPNATFTNDLFPRSRKRPPAFLRTIVAQGASIGANATILPGITIGRHAMIAAGAVVTRSVPPNAIVVGNPARITGYVDSMPAAESVAIAPGAAHDTVALGVGGAALHHLRTAEDMRGKLSVGEVPADVPFTPQRFFLVHGVPSGETRGAHAHRACEQFLVCIAGACSVVVDDGTHRAEVRLDSPGLGLYLPHMVWGIQYKYTADAVLLVLASLPYDSADYIRDYDTWLAELGRR